MARRSTLKAPPKPPRGERLRTIARGDIQPGMIIVRIPYIYESGSRIPFKDVWPDPPQRFYVDVWDVRRGRSQLTNMSGAGMLDLEIPAYPQHMLVEIDSLPAIYENPLSGRELLESLQVGAKVRLVAKPYGTRDLTVTEVPTRSATASHVNVFVTSGRTVGRTPRGGLLQVWRDEPDRILFQPTMTQQIVPVQSIDVVEMLPVANPIQHLLHRLVQGRSR